MNQDVLKAIQELLARVDASKVPSGILLWWRANQVSAYDGEAAPPIDQEEWQQVYYDLWGSTLPGYSLPTLDALKEKAGAHIRTGAVPIAIANLVYHRPDAALLAALQEAAAGNGKLELPESPEDALVSQRLFAASPLLEDRFDGFTRLPYVHAGRRTKFVIDRETYVTNSQEAPQKMEVDLDDGKGWRTVRFGRSFTARYADYSERRIRVRCIYADRVLESAFVLQLCQVTAPSPDLSWHLQGEAYEGKANTGTAWVYYGAGHNQIVKPFILVEGFPGGYGPTRMYDMLNAKYGLADELRRRGHDLIFVGFTNGKDYIQRNGMVVVRCIQDVIQRRSGTEPLIVTGASMGGLVARYALTRMESRSQDHQTRLFFSFDSPQQGAVIPVGVQAFVNFFAPVGESARTGKELFESIAARSMLKYRYAGTGSLIDPLHTKLFDELWSMGGYPRRVQKRYAIANGRGDGKELIPPSARTLHWHGNIFVWSDIWNEPHNRTEFVPVFTAYCIKIDFWNSYTVSVRNTLNYTGTPGGLRDTNKEVADGARAQNKGWVESAHDNHSFIPARSALDLLVGGIYDRVPAPGPNTSNFHDYVYGEDNEPHVHVSEKIYRFVLEKIAATAATGAEDLPPTRTELPTAGEVVIDKNGPSETPAESIEKAAPSKME